LEITFSRFKTISVKKARTVRNFRADLLKYYNAVSASWLSDDQ